MSSKTCNVTKSVKLYKRKAKGEKKLRVQWLLREKMIKVEKRAMYILLFFAIIPTWKIMGLCLMTRN